MKLLVCGGREYKDFNKVKAEIKKLNPQLVIHGDCKGADKMAEAAARNLNIESVAYPANWKKHGPAAGPIRNQQMLDEAKPDLVLAFPGHKGTADMIKRAEKAKIKVIKVED